MEREIKFRGKEIGTNFWVYGYYSRTQSGNHCIDEYEELIGCKCHFVDPSTVGQLLSGYIYEGDLITIDSTEIGGGIIEGEVFFNQDPTLSYIGWGLMTSSGYLPTDFMGKIEIIGNIHDSDTPIDKQSTETPDQ